MILVWRGWGLLGTVGFLLGLATEGFVSNVEYPWLKVLAGYAGFLASGLVCVHWGTRWNRPRVQHSLYGLPLQFWGWVDLVLAGVCLAVGLLGVFRQGLDRPGRMTQALAMALGLGLLVGLMALTARATQRLRTEAKP